jgi:virginiamycin B lyase
LQFYTPSHQNDYGGESIAAGPHHTLWFTKIDTTLLAEADMSGGIREFDTGLNASNIVEGPDNKMWFTGFTTSGLLYVCRIDSNGFVAKYPMQAAPGAIASGADGRLWFGLTSQGTSVGIGAMTIYGTLSIYPLQQNEIAGALTRGPDGYIWFNSEIGQVAYVGKMTPQGQETNYPIGSASFTGSIATGSDGKLWFTEYNPGGAFGIGRIDADGSNIIFFPTPTSPIHIVQGQRGFMWFTAAPPDFSSWEVDQISEHGKLVRNLAPASDRNANNLAYGPDGNLWIPDPRNDAIDVFVRRLMTVTPTSFSLTIGQSAPLSVAETGYKGKFTAKGCPSSIASVSPTGPGAFNITANGSGFCTITVRDSAFNSALVAVQVM